MPQIGEVKKGSELGRVSKSNNFAWYPCPQCGQPRWVRLIHGQPENKLCTVCGHKHLGPCSPETKAKISQAQMGGKANNWKGGRKRTGSGYIAIRIFPDDPFYCMTDTHGYALEHRLKVAKQIGRPLLKSEQVHHKDGIRDHNTESNLMLLSRENHSIYNKLCVDCPLRNEIRLLRLQVAGLSKQLQGKLMEKFEVNNNAYKESICSN